MFTVFFLGCWFGLAIISTLVSFFVSQSGIKKQLELNRQYYLENKEEAIDQRNLMG